MQQNNRTKRYDPPIFHWFSFLPSFFASFRNSCCSFNTLNLKVRRTFFGHPIGCFASHRLRFSPVDYWIQRKVRTISAFKSFTIPTFFFSFSAFAWYLLQDRYRTFSSFRCIRSWNTSTRGANTRFDYFWVVSKRFRISAGPLRK